MKDVQAGVVLLLSAGVLGWLWISGAASGAIGKLTGAVQGPVAGGASASPTGSTATPASRGGTA